MACQPSVSYAVVRFVSKSTGRDILQVSTMEVCFALKMSAMLHNQGQIDESVRIYERTGDLTQWIVSLRSVVPVETMQEVVFNLFDNSGTLYVFAILIRTGMLGDYLRSRPCADQAYIMQDVAALQARTKQFVPSSEHDDAVVFIQRAFQFE